MDGILEVLSYHYGRLKFRGSWRVAACHPNGVMVYHEAARPISDPVVRHLCR